MSKIEIKNLTVDYTEKKNRFTALKDVSFSIEEGEFVSIIGSSGCGKSTLLSILEGINFPTSGEILIDGEPIKGTGTDRGVVFQHYSLFPWMTARKNVAFGVKQVNKSASKAERLQIADEFLEKVGLENFKNKYPSQLSGGMQQRVAIARALAMDTDILLMDEPFGAIDAKNRTILQELLLELWEGDGTSPRKTVVFVTHDIDEAILRAACSDKGIQQVPQQAARDVLQRHCEQDRRRGGSAVMTIKKRYLRTVHFLFIALLLVQLLPDKLTTETYAGYVVWFAVGVEILTLTVSAIIKKPLGLTLFADIVSFIYGLLIAWTLATAKFNLLKPSLFPPPGRVFWQLIGDYEKIITNILSSVGIILQGYLLAAAAAIILGLLLGSSERLGNVATYIAKFLGAIPPIVYIPYGIALLPTFRSVSVFVIFLATFWPVLAGTMSGVMNVDKKTLDSARVLNVNRFTMLFSVILPASLPQIFIGCNQGLTVSFVLLTSAEMIGAQSGLGFYIKNYSDFGDYTRTLVGLIVIGIVIVVISFGFNKIQKYLLRWKH